MQWVFLVGGRGTRLGSLTDTVPKPLLPVAGRPFLDILVERAGSFGATEVLLLAGYLGDQFIDRYKDWRHPLVRWLVEPQPLAAGVVSPVHKAPPVEIIHVPLRAGPYEAGGHNWPSVKPKLVVELLTMNQAA